MRPETSWREPDRLGSLTTDCTNSRLPLLTWTLSIILVVMVPYLFVRDSLTSLTSTSDSSSESESEEESRVVLRPPRRDLPLECSFLCSCRPALLATGSVIATQSHLSCSRSHPSLSLLMSRPSWSSLPSTRPSSPGRAGVAWEEAEANGNAGGNLRIRDS